MADIDKIRRKIRKLEPNSVVRLGGLTDCFQPIERKVKNTYNTIKALNEQEVHYLIVTKSDLIIEQDYLDILDPNLCHVQVSIPSTENNILKELDNAPSFENRKKAIEVLNKNGFDVSIRLAPYLHNYVDINKINNIDSNKILIEFLRINSWIEKDMGNLINTGDFTLKQSNYKHLPLEKKIRLLKQIKIPQITVCDDVDEHYQYFKENINHNKNDCCNLRL